MIEPQYRKVDSYKVPSVKEILVLALPAIIENVLQVLLGISDTYFVGQLGKEAIAAVGVTNLMMNVFIAFFLAVSVGATAIIARYIGAKRPKQAAHSTKQALIIAICLGGVMGGFNLVYAPLILGKLGVETSVFVLALPYFRIVSGPVFLIGVIYTLSSTLRAAGDTVSPMKAGTVANVINIVLDYILIFGVLGIPGMGIYGAAIATTISRIINVFILIRVLKGYKSPLHIDFKSNWALDYKCIKDIIKVGIPASIEKLIMRSGQLLYGGMIITLGTSAYAAHNIAGVIESFSYLPGMGFGVAAATLVGQNLGSKNNKGAFEAGKKAYLLSTVFMVVIGSVFFIFARPLVMLFTKEPEVVSQGALVLRVIALFQPFLSATLVVTSALHGAGDTKFPMFASLLGIWGVRVLGVYILSIVFNFGLLGVWIAYALDVTLRGVLLVLRFKKGKWKHANVV